MKKLFPINFCDIGGIESYLHDMAADGLFIKKLGLIAEYEKGEPSKATYRLEPLMRAEKRPDDSIIDGYLDFGWKYVCTDENNMFHVFVSFDDKPEEIHTDIQAQKYSYDYIAERFEKSKRVNVIGIILDLSILLMCALSGVFDMRYYIESGTAVWLQTFIILSVIAMILSIRDSLRIKKLYNGLRLGIPIKHRTKYKKHYFSFIIITLITIISAARIGISIYSLQSGWNKNISEFTGKIPAITLYDIETEQFSIESSIYDGIDRNNNIEYKWSELSPVIYEINQRGVSGSRQWNDRSGQYSPSLKTKYYELRFKFLRKPLLEDIIDYELEFFKFSEIISEELPDTPFDYARFIKVDESQMLFAYYENKVIYVRYHGYGDLKSCIDKIYNKVEID